MLPEMSEENSNRAGKSLAAVVRTGLCVVTGAALFACGGAQAKAEASVDTEADASVDFDAEGSSSSRAPAGRSTNQAMTAGSAAPGTSGGPALFGARHDVRLKNPSETVACECLSVVVGLPSAPEFLWSGEPPIIDPTSQLVIALDSEGAPCATTKAPGASYRGYSVEGNDTVITLEATHPGRPTTRGAIIPRPTSGQLRITAPKALPYGKALSGGGQCTPKIPTVGK